MGLKAGHFALIALTGVVIVLLLLAPHTSDQPVVVETENAAPLEPPTVENQIDSALAIIASEAPMQGILLLRSIADEHPDNFRAQYHLGRFSAQTGQWEKVIERFEIVQAIDPDFTESDYWLGTSKMQLGRTEEARIHLQRFVADDKNNEQLRNEAVTMLNQNN
jgi:tetratricopeptide (TPR) repeat protein